VPVGLGPRRWPPTRRSRSRLPARRSGTHPPGRLGGGVGSARTTVRRLASNTATSATLAAVTTAVSGSPLPCIKGAVTRSETPRVPIRAQAATLVTGERSFMATRGTNWSLPWSWSPEGTQVMPDDSAAAAVTPDKVPVFEFVVVRAPRTWRRPRSPAAVCRVGPCRGVRAAAGGAAGRARRGCPAGLVAHRLSIRRWPFRVRPRLDRPGPTTTVTGDPASVPALMGGVSF